MADKSYDAIIIGGGHHGTIMAPYLPSGMKVGVFERLDHLGAELSRRSPGPGFRGNFCPISRDFTVIRLQDSSREEGLEYTFRTPMKPSSLTTAPAMSAYAASPWSTAQTEKPNTTRRTSRRPMSRSQRFSKVGCRDLSRSDEKYKNSWRAAFHQVTGIHLPRHGECPTLEELCNDPKAGWKSHAVHDLQANSPLLLSKAMS